MSSIEGPAEFAQPAATSSDERRIRVIERQHYVTGRLSETCRYIAFGLLAIYYTANFQEKDTRISELVSEHPISFYYIGSFSVISILADYLQYLFARRSAKEALDRPDSKYDPASLAYLGNELFFRMKQATAVAGAVALL